MRFNRSIEYCKMCIFKEVEKEVENMNYDLQKTNESMNVLLHGRTFESSSHKTQNLITA